MKRFVPLGLITIFILSALIVVFPSTTNGQGAGLVSSVLNRMEKNRQSLRTLRAGISMEKYNSQLRDSDRYHGVVLYMYMSRQQLESRFQPLQDVREESLWGDVSTIHLTLVPKGNASYKYAEIWIDSSGMPVQTKIVEKNDDATTMRLTGLEKNVKISADEFNIKLDPNVKIVKG